MRSAALAIECAFHGSSNAGHLFLAVNAGLACQDAGVLRACSAAKPVSATLFLSRRSLFRLCTRVNSLFPMTASVPVPRCACSQRSCHRRMLWMCVFGACLARARMCSAQCLPCKACGCAVPASRRPASFLAGRFSARGRADCRCVSLGAVAGLWASRWGRLFGCTMNVWWGWLGHLCSRRVP